MLQLFKKIFGYTASGADIVIRLFFKWDAFNVFVVDPPTHSTNPVGHVNSPNCSFYDKSINNNSTAKHDIETEQVVPGDPLLLTSGTRVAADGKVLLSLSLHVDESALTGESFP